LNIEVSDDQVDDRVDEAIQLYYHHHYDGTQKSFYKYKLTANDIANKYITLPENILGVTRIFPLGTSIAMNSIFSFQYQWALNNIFDLTSTQLAPYYMNMQYIQLIEQILVGVQPVRFNKNQGRLYIDMTWTRVQPDFHIMIECYQVIDPDEYTEMWNDYWLKQYATALIKYQWGSNLSKFQDQQLPGGMKFNGTQILKDAEQEIKEIQETVIEKWGGVLEIFSG
jgi:virulence-associated protein VapD